MTDQHISQHHQVGDNRLRFLITLTIVLVACAALAAYGTIRAFTQAFYLDTFEPVSAKINDVQISHNTLGFSAPEITYTYQIGSTQFTDNQYAPLNLTGSAVWANRAAAQFRPQENIVAYVCPRNPTFSFISPTASFIPYTANLLAILLLSTTYLVTRNAGPYDTRPLSKNPSKYQWAKLIPNTTPMLSAMTLIMLSFFWFILSALNIAHYLLFAYIPATSPIISPLLISTAIAAVTVAPAFAGFRTLKYTNHIHYTAAEATTPTLPLNAGLTVRTQQLFARKTQLKSLSLRLVCDQTTGFSRTRLFQSTSDIPLPQIIKPVESLAYSHTFSIPKNKRRPSSPFSRVDFPRIDWAIEIATTFPTGRTIVTRFPIIAEYTPNN